MIPRVMNLMIRLTLAIWNTKLTTSCMMPTSITSEIEIGLICTLDHHHSQTTLLPILNSALRIWLSGDGQLISTESETFHMDSVLEKECDMAWRSDSGFCWCAADRLWVRVFWLPRALIQGKPNYSSAYQWHSLLAHCTLQKKQFKMEAHILEWSKVIFLAFSLQVVLITFVGILPCWSSFMVSESSGDIRFKCQDIPEAVPWLWGSQANWMINVSSDNQDPQNQTNSGILSRLCYDSFLYNKHMVY